MESAIEQAGTSDTVPARSRAAPTLLIVDDDLETLRALRSSLSALGDVLAASDGTSAMDMLRSVPVDLLVCDLRLPDGSGVDVIAQARALQPDMYALLLTGHAKLADLADAINRAGVYRYLAKPVDMDDLLATARAALEAQSLKRERERLHGELERSHAAMRTLYDAARELSSAPGRIEIASATLKHLAGAVPYALGGLLVAPRGAPRPTLYLQTAMAVDEGTLSAFKTRIVGEHTRRAAPAVAPRARHDTAESAVRLVFLTPQGAHRPLPANLHLVDVPLDVGPASLGAVQLLCASPPSLEARHLIGVLATEAAHALRRVEALSLAHEQQLDLLVRSLADGIVVVGSEQTVTLANPAARAMLGLEPSPDAPVDNAAIATALGFDPFALVRAFEQAGAQPVRREVTSEERTLHVLASPIASADGRVAGVGLVLRDLSAEKELERRKEEFVSIVSHELRTPLASITGALELLVRGYVGELTEKQRHYLELGQGSCARLRGVLDDLLDLAKFERAELELELEPMELGALLREAAGQYEAAAVERNVRIECTAEGPAPVLADGARLFQVLNNLCSNALKFVRPKGRIEVQLLRAEALADLVGFTVYNDGPRVEDADLERMFEKFRQLPGSRRRIGGTGLGLPIARGLMETHGGRLWAKSGVAQGVRFIAVLPRVPNANTPFEVRAELAEALRRANEETPGRVVVAHPDPPTAWLIKGALSVYGLSASTVTTPDELVAACRRARPMAAVVEESLWGARSEHRQVFAHDPELRGVPLVTLSKRGSASEVPGVHLTTPATAASLASAVLRATQEGARAASARVLVVVSRAELRAPLTDALARDGLEVEAVGDAGAAIQAARMGVPDLLIAEVGDGEEGFELARALDAGRAGGPALLFIAQEGTLSQKVRAFREGALDFLVEPFDLTLVRERARAALARRPGPEHTATTGLPGAHAIDRELRRRIAGGEPYACLHLTLARLDAYARDYGFAKAEAVVHQVGALLREVLVSTGGVLDFAGHVEREHFVVLAQPERAEAIAQATLNALQRVLPLYYSREDRAVGGRFGPLMDAVVVILEDPGGRFVEPGELASASAAARKAHPRTPLLRA